MTTTRQFLGETQPMSRAWRWFLWGSLIFNAVCDTARWWLS